MSSIEFRPYSTLTGTFLLCGFGHGAHGGRGNSGALQRRRKRRLGIWEICCFGTAAARPWLVKVGRSHVGSSSVANRNSEDRSDGGGATSATQHGAIPLPSCPIYSAGHRRLGDRRDETRAQIQICAPDVEQTASNDRAGYLTFQCNQNQIWIAKSVPCCSTFLARLFLPQMSSLSHSSSAL